MTFGQRNASGNFQRMMYVLLSAVKYQFVLVYLDDIVIVSRSPTKHIAHVRRVLSILKNAVMTLKLKKCRFFAETIDYLEQILRSRRFEKASHTTDARRERKGPTNLTELHSILVLCTVFRRIVPNNARLASSIYRKLKKAQLSTFQT